MLKGIDSLLTPELPRCSAMGHDDEIAIVDATYPAASAGSKILRLAGVFATAALDSVLSVMPLDDFDATAVWCEVVVGAPDAEEPIFEEFRSIIRRHEVRRSPWASSNERGSTTERVRQPQSS